MYKCRGYVRRVAKCRHQFQWVAFVTLQTGTIKKSSLFDEGHFGRGEVGKRGGCTGIHKTSQTTNQMKAVHIHLKILAKPVKAVNLIAGITTGEAIL